MTCRDCHGIEYGSIHGTPEEIARWTKIAILRNFIERRHKMSEAFEKWKVKYLKDNFMCEIGWVEGSKESIASKMSRAAYKAGQNQRDEEVNDLKRKLFLEGVKNNSRVARVEFLEDKLKALEVET